MDKETYQAAMAAWREATLAQARELEAQGRGREAAALATYVRDSIKR